MLVLMREAGIGGIKIGDDIEIRILSVKGDRVRIGIDAPREISISRFEEGGMTSRGDDRRKAERVERKKRILKSSEGDGNES